LAVSLLIEMAIVQFEFVKIENGSEFRSIFYYLLLTK